MGILLIETTTQTLKPEPEKMPRLKQTHEGLSKPYSANLKVERCEAHPPRIPKAE